MKILNFKEFVNEKYEYPEWDRSKEVYSVIQYDLRELFIGIFKDFAISELHLSNMLAEKWASKFWNQMYDWCDNLLDSSLLDKDICTYWYDGDNRNDSEYYDIVGYDDDDNEWGIGKLLNELNPFFTENCPELLDYIMYDDHKNLDAVNDELKEKYRHRMASTSYHPLYSVRETDD